MLHESNERGEGAASNGVGLSLKMRDAGLGVLEVTVGACRHDPVRGRTVAPELLRATLTQDKYTHWLIRLEGVLSEAALDAVTALFPRRVSVGRVAIVCQRAALMQGVVFAASVTLPLVPRPLRVFSSDDADQAFRWVTGSAEPRPASALDVAEQIMVGPVRTRTLPN